MLGTACWARIACVSREFGVGIARNGLAIHCVVVCNTMYKMTDLQVLGVVLYYIYMLYSCTKPQITKLIHQTDAQNPLNIHPVVNACHVIHGSVFGCVGVFQNGGVPS